MHRDIFTVDDSGDHPMITVNPDEEAKPGERFVESMVDDGRVKWKKTDKRSDLPRVDWVRRQGAIRKRNQRQRQKAAK